MEEVLTNGGVPKEQGEFLNLMADTRVSSFPKNQLLGEQTLLHDCW